MLLAYDPATKLHIPRGGTLITPWSDAVKMQVERSGLTEVPGDHVLTLMGTDPVDDIP